MSTNEKKGITVKIDAKLHAEVRQFLDKHEMTMAEFVTLALQDELRPKINLQEGKNMGNMRTLAFQVPEELFQQIKDYLQRNNMTQKQFVIGLIETEIERDLTQHAAMDEVHTESEEMAKEQEEGQETAAVIDCEGVLKEAEEEDFCFIEDIQISGFENKIRTVILYQWNRRYPADRYFLLDLSDGSWELQRTEELKGSSHEKITKGVYERVR